MFSVCLQCPLLLKSTEARLIKTWTHEAPPPPCSATSGVLRGPGANSLTTLDDAWRGKTCGGEASCVHILNSRASVIYRNKPSPGSGSINSQNQEQHKAQQGQNWWQTREPLLSPWLPWSPIGTTWFVSWQGYCIVTIMGWMKCPRHRVRK